ncbi:hypothetical protein U9M48_011137, partial [Paspalum notatum var. saurae]
MQRIISSVQLIKYLSHLHAFRSAFVAPLAVPLVVPLYAQVGPPLTHDRRIGPSSPLRLHHDWIPRVLLQPQPPQQCTSLKPYVCPFPEPPLRVSPARPLPLIAPPLLLMPIHQPPHSSALNNVSRSSRNLTLHVVGSSEAEGEIANNNENVDPQEDHDWLQGKNSPLQQRQGLRSEQIESRRAKDRARYANMTPEQRQAIRDRQNARIMKPNQKQAKKDYDRAHLEDHGEAKQDGDHVMAFQFYKETNK